MKIVNRNFGHRIEEIATCIGDQVCRAKDHELETLKLGFISDEEKLRMLKRDLYEAARGRANTEYIQGLRTAINTLSTQLENERTYKNSFTYQLNAIVNSIILLIILGFSFSFPMAWGCGVVKSLSAACETSRIIPNTAIRFFSEPK